MNTPFKRPTIISAITWVIAGLVGLLWIVATYAFNGDYPIPGIGNWNLGIGFGLVGISGVAAVLAIVFGVLWATKRA